LSPRDRRGDRSPRRPAGIASSAPASVCLTAGVVFYCSGSATELSGGMRGSNSL